VVESAAHAASAPTGIVGWPRAALLSLSDKTGAAEFAALLVQGGSRVLASGGTYAHLRQAGVPVTAVEEWTGFGEMLGGRVKTLHPHVHAPILARRSSPDDMADVEARGLEPLDLVAVTLYPFEERGRTLDDASMIEDIDIGGVALLRAAAKNHDGVIVVHDPAQYAEVADALSRGVTPADRRRWAMSAFARTARYDGAIASELAQRIAGPEEPPAVQALVLERTRTLRYGENPHQPAALYIRMGSPSGLAAVRESKQLSYNNLVDLAAAVGLAGRFERPACVIVKHGQPCGVACAATLDDAWALALASDPVSAFGGVVALNGELDRATAAAIADRFVECVAFANLTREAEAVLAGKKNLRLVRLTAADVASGDAWQLKLAGPWALLQRDSTAPAPPWRTVTRRAPSADEMTALVFAWEVVSAARSNAIALARGEVLVGLGSGQTSRVDAVDLAIAKAGRTGHDLVGTALASDGFFPFADGLAHAAAAGVRAVVQPGGSVKDAEVIAEADRMGVAMVFSDRRVFRH
jgi:phosphoribosylaminoimidazolecarboxamide formyltransferase/IMP cyclohydrolase